MGHSKPEVMVMRGGGIPHSSDLKPHNQMQFNVIPWTLLLQWLQWPYSSPYVGPMSFTNQKFTTNINTDTNCDVTPSPPPRYVNFFEPFLFTAGDQLVVPIGVSYISS